MHALLAAASAGGDELRWFAGDRITYLTVSGLFTAIMAFGLPKSGLPWIISLMAFAAGTRFRGYAADNLREEYRGWFLMAFLAKHLFLKSFQPFLALIFFRSQRFRRFDVLHR